MGMDHYSLYSRVFDPRKQALLVTALSSKSLLLLKVVEKDQFEQALPVLVDQLTEQLNVFPHLHSIIHLGRQIGEHLDIETFESQ